jgi:predicted transcriptional regulator
MPDDAIGSMPLSIRIPADLLESLDRLAKILDRPRSWVVLRALRLYLADEGQDLFEVDAGIAELERGESVQMDEALEALDMTVRRAGVKRGNSE